MCTWGTGCTQAHGRPWTQGEAHCKGATHRRQAGTGVYSHLLGILAHTEKGLDLQPHGLRWEESLEEDLKQ